MELSQRKADFVMLNNETDAGQNQSEEDGLDQAC